MARKHNLPFSGLNSDSASVIVSETELGHLTQLAGWGTFAEAAGEALQAHSLPLPTDYRRPVREGTVTVWRIAPDRVLVRSNNELGLEGTDELVTLDLSDARICLTVTGDGAAGLLSRIIALDFSDQAFPTGTFVQTSLHHVGVLIERQDKDQFIVLMPTTWARSLTDLLVTHLAVAV
jgi:methylglutamate dehydrogenase subunit D